jgi:hypothetical protein
LLFIPIPPWLNSKRRIPSQEEDHQQTPNDPMISTDKCDSF